MNRTEVSIKWASLSEKPVATVFRHTRFSDTVFRHRRFSGTVTQCSDTGSSVTQCSDTGGSAVTQCSDTGGSVTQWHSVQAQEVQWHSVQTQEVQWHSDTVFRHRRLAVSSSVSMAALWWHSSDLLTTVSFIDIHMSFCLCTAVTLALCLSPKGVYEPAVLANRLLERRGINV